VLCIAILTLAAHRCGPLAREGAAIGIAHIDDRVSQLLGTEKDRGYLSDPVKDQGV
jgi:hypothetical protein